MLPNALLAVMMLGFDCFCAGVGFNRTVPRLEDLTVCGVAKPGISRTGVRRRVIHTNLIMLAMVI
jgi:hypothetical protein